MQRHQGAGGFLIEFCPKSGTFAERGTIAYGVLTVRKAEAKQVALAQYST